MIVCLTTGERCPRRSIDDYWPIRTRASPFQGHGNPANKRLGRNVTYDGVGNRLTRVVGSTTDAYAYSPTANQISTVTTGSEVGNNQDKHQCTED
jgi:hypothetical protein